MTFASTRSPEKVTGLREALFRGLAPDGGLYHPVEKPDLSAVFGSFEPDAPFVEVATRLVSALFPDEFGSEKARKICEEAFPFSPELSWVSEGHAILELYHGPSCAFKDFGASFLATLMQHYLADGNERAVILTATSGDTGSAVAQAFLGRENIDVVILYPSGRVSPLQEKQLTTLGENIHALEVTGSFDDCQRMAKEAFMDSGLRLGSRLTSANSINLGRLLPQSFYYVYGRLLARCPLPYFCVPSGNFGNLTAGVLASEWGLPVRRFIAATNINDVVPEYLATGSYYPRASERTLSNAMDVGNPSNFERLEAIFARNPEAMRQRIVGEVVTDSQTLRVIRRYHEEHHRFFDPHTATGVLAAERLLSRESGATVITLATAHPAKFLEIVEEATGVRPSIPERLSRLLAREKLATVVGPDYRELKTFLTDRFGG
ncbi:MAG: threonine synthase [Spirochaetaceae bacterium]